MEAQHNLGSMYFNGTSVEKDYKQAKEWYEKSAAQGNSFAKCELGRIYALGLGVKKDLERAKKLVQEVIVQGDAAEKKARELYELLTMLE